MNVSAPTLTVIAVLAAPIGHVVTLSTIISVEKQLAVTLSLIAFVVVSIVIDAVKS